VWGALQQQVEQLVPLLEGPGTVLAAYCEVHCFLSGLRARAGAARQRGQAAEVGEGRGFRVRVGIGIGCWSLQKRARAPCWRPTARCTASCRA